MTWLAKVKQNSEGETKNTRTRKESSVQNDKIEPKRPKKKTASEEKDIGAVVSAAAKAVDKSDSKKVAVRKLHPVEDEHSDPSKWLGDEDIPLKPKKPKKSKTEAGREKQMVSLAVDLAEQQLRDGTASAQVITHFLKLGTEKEKLEREILAVQKELITEKTKALKSMKQMEDLYTQALEAMKHYSRNDEE